MNFEIIVLGSPRDIKIGDIIPSAFKGETGLKVTATRESRHEGANVAWVTTEDGAEEPWWIGALEIMRETEPDLGLTKVHTISGAKVHLSQDNRITLCGSTVANSGMGDDICKRCLTGQTRLKAEYDHNRRMAYQANVSAENEALGFGVDYERASAWRRSERGEWPLDRKPLRPTKPSRMGIINDMVDQALTKMSDRLFAQHHGNVPCPAQEDPSAWCDRCIKVTADLIDAQPKIHEAAEQTYELDQARMRREQREAAELARMARPTPLTLARILNRRRETLTV